MNDPYAEYCKLKQILEEGKGDKMLGENIKAERNRKNLTQSELAHAVNVSTMSILNYEKNVRVPDALKLRDIAKVLEVTTDELLKE